MIWGKEIARFSFLPYTSSMTDAIRLITDLASLRLCAGNSDLEYVQSKHKL